MTAPTHAQPFSKGLAPIVKALAQLNDMFSNKHIGCIGNQSDLPVFAHFIQENNLALGQSVDVVPQNQGIVRLNERTGQRFVNLLIRAARGQEGVSRQERLFLQQVWAQIDALYSARNK